MTTAADDRCYLLTPSGAGAIAIIRIMGPNAHAIIDRIFLPSTGAKHRIGEIGPLWYGRMEGSDGEIVDDVLVTCAETNRITNGDSLSTFDMTTHGGVRVVERVLEVLQQAGAPLATDDATEQVWQPQTTIEYEALDALAGAKTARAVRFCAWQRSNLASALEEAAALCTIQPTQASEMLRDMISGFTAARHLLGGVRMTLVGLPNSGKSTLFNRLVGRSAALVSHHAGTTRDWVSETVEFDGVPIELLDTAGRHDRGDAVENAAIQAGHDVEREADLSLLVVDSSAPPPSAGLISNYQVGENSPVRVVMFSKIDLLSEATQWPTAPAGVQVIHVSARTGLGIRELVVYCLKSLGFDALEDSSPYLFTARQVDKAKQAMARIDCNPVQAATLIRKKLIGT